MAKSEDDRQTVISLYNGGCTAATITKVMSSDSKSISSTTVYRIIRAHRDALEGQSTAKIRKKRVTKFSRHGRILETIVQRKLAENIPFTTASIRLDLITAIRQLISLDVVRRALIDLNLSFKVGEKQWRECSPQRCREYWANYACFVRPHHNPSDMLFLDESSFDPHEVQGRQWLPKGRHIVKVSGKTYGKRISVCALLGYDGIVDRMFTTGTYKADDYMAVLHRMCAKVADRNMVMVLDNARSHRTTDVQLYSTLADQYGIHFVFLPGYAPHLNPIETVFALVKRKIRTNKPPGEKHTQYIMDCLDTVQKYLNIPALYRSIGYI